jgi:hypothetical protein
MKRKLIAVLLVVGLASGVWFVLSGAPDRTRSRPSGGGEAAPGSSVPTVLAPGAGPGDAPGKAAPATHGGAKPGSPGTSSDLDALVVQLHLRPEQRERVRLILIDMRSELDRALRELPNRADGSADTGAMDRASDAVLARADARMRDALDPDQRAIFDGARSGK